MRKLRFAIIFVVVAVLVITAVSCGKKKPTEPEEGEAILADETVVLDETEAESIIEVTDDQIVLPVGTNPSIYQKGNVIMSGVTDVAPYGLLRKVESSSVQNGQIVVNTSQARLVDAFDQLDFHTTQSLKTTDLVSSEALIDGVRFIQDSKNPYHYPYTIDVELDVGNNVTMYIDGELDLTLGYELDVDISLLRGLHHIKAGSFVTSESNLELNVDGAFNYQKPIELYQHIFAPVTFWIPGPVPGLIILVPKVIIVLDIDARGEAHVTATVTTSASVKAGLEYQKPNWSSYCEKDFDFGYDIPEVDASMNATVSAGPRFEINLFGVTGPWAHARGFLNLDADINANPWWTLTGGYVVDAGVHFEIFGYEESATIPNIINHSVVLAQASQNQVATPTFNPPGGTYTSAQNVTISCATPGVTIYYSTDGSTPSIRYTKPVNISSTATLKAKATKAGWTDSQIASAVYTINQPQTVATPTFSPPGGTYISAQSVRITCATSGATIRYTTNGTEPTANSPTYSSPINVSSTTTIKAKGFKNGWTPSSIASASYNIQSGDTWYEKSQFTRNQIGASTFTISNKGYVVGGGRNTGTTIWGTKSCSEYDPLTNTWTSKAPHDGKGLWYSASFAISSFGFIVGGRYRSEVNGSISTHTSNEVWRYNSMNDSWAKLSDFPGVSRTGAFGVSVGNIGYVGFGRYCSYSSWGDYHNDLWSYNPQGGQWTQLADFPGEARQMATAFVIDNTIYVFGGVNASGKLNDLWAYNTTTNSWTQKSSSPTGGISEAVGFSDGNYGYIATGRSNSGDLNTLWRYDSSNDNWAQCSPLPGNVRGGAFGFAAANLLYVGGGCSSSSWYRDFWVYVP